MKKLLNIILIVLLSFSLQSCGLLSAAGLSKQGLSAKKVENLSQANSKSAVSLDHSKWTALLKKHVNSDGFVDYKGFESDKPALKEYLNYLSSFSPDPTWSVQEQLAFYINLYNAYTVDLIVENYPTDSIKDLDGPWTKAFVPIGNTKISLGGIENSILRKMNEPRIHFAINCASYSCPKLLDEAFTAQNIDAQLDRVTREFINSNKNDITKEGAQVSKIFDWYKADYLSDALPTLREYINKYSDLPIATEAPITFKEYDWSLNKQ